MKIEIFSNWDYAELTWRVNKFLADHGTSVSEVQFRTSWDNCCGKVRYAVMIMYYGEDSE